MGLTKEAILAAPDDEALFELLSEELSKRLPDDVQENRELYHQKLGSLPRGLRAMAGMHFFDKSMALDSLAWHFGNQNDERDLRETSNGLRELELFEIADMFDQVWKFMEPHLDKLRREEIVADDFSDWLEQIGAEKLANPMDDYIWDYCRTAGDLGLLQSWVVYARKYPERCVMVEA